MTIRASFQKKYLWRYLLLAVPCLAYSAWFLYDGFIGYPQQLERRKAYDQLAETLKDDKLEVAWRSKVQEKNWPRSVPDKTATEIEQGIGGQFFWAGITGLVGFPALIYFARSINSWVERTSTGLKTSWGQTVNFSDVTHLDKRRWPDKGIAKATYSDNGRQRVFVFDDFKFDREAIGSILRDLEENLSPNNIRQADEKPKPKSSPTTSQETD